MNQELIAAYREARSRPLSLATSALREARGSLTHAPLELDFYTDMPEVFEYEGKWVRVETGYDDVGLLWDEDSIGELHGFEGGRGRYDRDDLERYDHPNGEHVFRCSENVHAWNTRFCGYTPPESLAELARFYRRSGMSKQMAFEAAMRQIKSQFEYALEVHERGVVRALPARVGTRDRGRGSRQRE